MQFGTSKDNIQDSGQAPFLSMPYLGPARLVKVYKEDIEGKDGTTYPNVLKFQFKVLGEDIEGNNVKGHIIEKAEFPPREDDDQEKVNNKTGRIGYIMKYFMSEEDAIIDGSQIKNWEHFVDTVLKRFEKNSDFNEVPVRLKVPANVYNGSANLQIPNYKGFLQGKDSDHSISFSRSEQQDNRKYQEAQTLPGDDEEPVGVGAGDADDLF